MSEGHLLRNVGFCPTTVVSEPGCSLDFHVECREFDPGDLRCIRLLEDSGPCVGVAAAIPDVNHSSRIARNLRGGGMYQGTISEKAFNAQHGILPYNSYSQWQRVEMELHVHHGRSWRGLSLARQQLGSGPSVNLLSSSTYAMLRPVMLAS